jgi:peptide/nickel transport system substrate-binding protein
VLSPSVREAPSPPPLAPVSDAPGIGRRAEQWRKATAPRPFSKDDQRGLVRSPRSNCISFLSLTTTITPLDDRKVRQAIQFVVDKRGMLLAGGGDRAGTTAGHVLIPGIPGFDEAGGVGYDPYGSGDSRGDVDRARALMQAAGFPDGMYRGPPLLFVGSNDNQSRRVADLIEASLKKIGIALDRKEYDPKVASEEIGRPAGGAAVSASGWCSDYPDAVTVIKPLFDGRLIADENNLNTALLNDPAVNALIDRATLARGEERARLWAETTRLVMELAPVVPLTWDNIVTVLSPRVRGAIFPLGLSAGIDLATVWLDTVDDQD